MTDQTYRYRHVPPLAETTVDGTVYFAQFQLWQGYCREHFLADHAPGVLMMLRDRTLAMVTLSCSMYYYALCHAFDEIEVLMTARASSGNRVILDFDFQRDQQLIAHGSQTLACMRPFTGGVLPTGIPAELEDALRRFGPAGAP